MLPSRRSREGLGARGPSPRPAASWRPLEPGQGALSLVKCAEPFRVVPGTSQNRNVFMALGKGSRSHHGGHLPAVIAWSCPAGWCPLSLPIRTFCCPRSRKSPLGTVTRLSIRDTPTWSCQVWLVTFFHMGLDSNHSHAPSPPSSAASQQAAPF